MNPNNFIISVVIPTCNRHNSLIRTLESLSMQSLLPDEVIVVDASEKIIDEAVLSSIEKIKIKVLSSTPSVCIQRNKGIQNCKGEYILLCDDDIIFPENYIEKLYKYIRKKQCKIVTGFWHQLENDDKWHVSYPPVSFWDLLFRFIFGLSIWGSISEVKVQPYQRALFEYLKTFYNKKGNCLTKSGWPINTDFKNQITEVKVTSLGAALIKKKWLLKALFEEVLDPYGIGDNYGVCIQLPEKEFIHVLTKVPVYHFKSKENRLKAATSFFRRNLALHFFLKTIPVFKRKEQLYFYWSSIGIILRHLISFDLLRLKYALRIFYLILFNKNPYIIGKNKNQKVIIPS